MSENFNAAALIAGSAAEIVLDQNRLDTDEPDPTFSAAEHARAASFGAIAEPAGQGNERMERGADIRGEWSIGPGFTAPLRELNGIEYTLSGQAKDKDGDGVDDDEEEAGDEMRQIGEEQREERERWSQEMHSYAGIEMSGKEWGEFADDLSGDTPLRKWLVDGIKAKENKTDDEAKKEADQISTLARMQSLPKDQ